MKKARYKAGLIVALLVVFIGCAIFALSGYFKNKGDSATEPVADISASENIAPPENSVSTTAITTGSNARNAWNAVRNNSTINFSLQEDWNMDLYPTSDNYIEIRNGQDVTFNGNGHTITGGGKASQAFYVDNGGSLTLNNVKIEGFDSGLYLGDDVGTPYNYVSIDFVEIYNCNDGVYCYESNASLSLSDCSIHDNNGYGVYVENSMQYLQSFYWNDGSCYNNGDGIYLNPAYYCDIVELIGGKIYDNDGFGIHLDCDFRHQMFIEGSGGGSSLTSFTKPIEIYGNRIGVETSHDCVILDAKIYDNTDYGVLAHSGTVYLTGDANGDYDLNYGNSGYAEVYGNGVGVEIRDEALKMPAGKIYNNRLGVRLNSSTNSLMYVSGTAQVCDNVDASGLRHNIVSTATTPLTSGIIYLEHALTAGANLWVSNTGVITAGYVSTAGQGTSNPYIHSDHSDNISVTGGEVVFSPSYATRWNNLISSSTSSTNYEFVLDAGDWTANSSTGFGSGVGFCGSYGDGDEAGGDGFIFVPSGKTVTINLGDRNIDGSAVPPTCGIVVKGTLNIKGTTGQIRNCAYICGGVVYIDDYGTVNMYGGTICGNTNVDAVMLEMSSCEFNMYGGTLTTSDQKGRGISNNGGTLTMSGGTIKNCTTGIDMGDGTLTMSGGTISNNSDNGVHVRGTNAKFTMSNGTISGSKIGVNVSNGGTFNLNGGTISDNTTYGVHGTSSNDNINVNGGNVTGNNYGINCSDGNFTMTGGNVYANKQYGILFFGSNFSITGGKIYGNLSSGVVIWSTSTTNPGTISGTVEIYNNAGYGLACGEIDEPQEFCVVLSGGTIRNNTLGGMIVYRSYSSADFAVTMTGGAITDNTGNGVSISGDNSSKFKMSGGTISGSGCDVGVLLQNGKFEMSGTAQITGVALVGVQMLNGAFEMKGGTISGVTSGVSQDAGTFTMSGGTITGCETGVGTEATFNMTGGTITSSDHYNVYLSESSGAHGTFTMSGGTVSDGVNTSIVVEPNCTFNMTAGEISGSGDGGVNVEGTFTMSGGAITNNTNYGVQLVNAGTFTMSGGTISGSGCDVGVLLQNGKFEMSGTAQISEVALMGVQMLNGAFDMKGGTISGVTSGVTQDGGTFTMSGGTITGCETGVNTEATFTMTGGTITSSDHYNVSINESSGSHGAFTMSGGTISDGVNNGVLVDANCTFNMTAGEISDNGVFGVTVGENSVFNMSGTAQISGNGSNGIDVYKGTVTLTAGTVSGNGEGVFVGDGAFTMSGGSVIDNSGYGVEISGANSVFTMSGNALIDGNSNSGVYVGSNAIFNMEGGAIGTVGNGNTSTGLGGGVYSYGGTLNITGGEIVANTATTNGGGIAVSGGKFTIANVSIKDNKAANGAGVYVAGSSVTGSVSDTVLTGNAATGEGGAINVTGGTVDITNCTIGGSTPSLANSAQYGAGLRISAGAVSLNGGAITGNNASVSGGGAYISGGTLAIGSVTVNGNVGGGIVVADSGAVTMSGAPKIQNNFDLNNEKSNLVLPEGKKITLTGAFETGAVIYVTGKNAVTTNYSTYNGSNLPRVYFFADDPDVNVVLRDGEAYFSGDLADLWNEAVETSSTENPVEFELPRDWAAQNNSFGTGAGFKNGALYIPAGKSIILTSNGYTISGETYGYIILVEGKLVIKDGADITIQCEKTSNNDAGVQVDGGTFIMNGGFITGGFDGVRVDNGTFEMNGGEIYDCNAEEAVLVENSGTFIMNGGVIYDCGNYGVNLDTGTFEMNGGEIHGNDIGILVAGASFTMKGGEIYGNTQYGVGVNGGTVSIIDGKIFENGNGLDINNNGSNTVTISGGEIYKNSSGIFIYKSELTVDGGRIYDNVQYGLEISETSTVNISGGSISGNGKGVYADKSEITLTGGEIFGNDEQGLYASNLATLNMTGGKIYDNNGAGISGAWTMTLTGGEIFGNHYAGVRTLPSIKVSGSIKIYNNVDENGNADNIHQVRVNQVEVVGALTADARIYVNFNGVVTSGFSSYTHGATFDEIFFPDIVGSDVKLVDGEVSMTINYEAMWNAAVQESLDNNSKVTFTLHTDWTSANDGSFGASSGVGFDDNGAILVPFGANIVLDLNNYTITHQNTAGNIGNCACVIKVGGTLEIIDGSSNKGGGITTTSGDGYTKATAGISTDAGSSITIRNGSYYGFDYALDSFGKTLIAGGDFYSNQIGISISAAQSEMTGGTIRSNSHNAINVESGSDLLISGGEIYSNKDGIDLYGGNVTLEDGIIRTGSGNGVNIASDGSTFTMNGGEIRDFDYCIYVQSGDSVTINGGKIHGADTAGIYVCGDCTFTMNGGEFYMNYGNVAIVENAVFNMYGGEIYNPDGENNVGLTENAVFNMYGGSIYECTGGHNVYICDSNATFNMYGGEIYNSALSGVEIDYGGTFNLYGGEIYGNETGVNITNGKAYLYGGAITGNECGVLFNGASASLYIGGPVQVYDNIYANVSLGSGKVINITDSLIQDGVAANIGVYYSGNVTFTSGYGAHNSGYAPATFFFSDSNDYSVVSVGTGTTTEARLGPHIDQSTIVWRYTAVQNGTTIENNVAIDGVYLGLEFEDGVVYTVQAINGKTGSTVSFSVNGGTEVTSLTVNDIGKFAMVVNNSTGEFINTVCTFEVLRVNIDWEYKIEGESESGWKAVDFESFEYTGRTYQFRAMRDGDLVQSFASSADAACNAGTYTYTVDQTKFVNYELTIEILVRKVEVEWNYGDATASDGVYGWTYDGFNHAPVPSLKNIGGDLAGLIDLNLTYTTGSVNGSYAPVDAGNYTVTVNISSAYDGNVEISNTSANFCIRKLGLGVVWRDEHNVSGTQFTIAYDGKEHFVTAVADGLLPGDISPLSVKYTQNGKEVSAPVNAGTYTATAVIETEGNYTLRNVYTCEIIIEAGDISVIFTGNEENGGEFVWTFNGRGRTPAVSVVSKATGGEIANFKVEYATADNNGNPLDAFTANVPVNAGSYVVRVTVSDADGNELAQESKAFAIAQMEVTIDWSGDGGEQDGSVIRFEYDGKGHTVNPSVTVNVVDEYGYVTTSLDVSASGNDALVNAGSATATAALKDTAYNKNFTVIAGTSQKYEVYKKVITSFVWEDTFGNTYNDGDVPEYDHGTISGANGPELILKVDGQTVEFDYAYSASFDGLWAADEVNGYTVTATLKPEYAVNYEFADDATSVSLTFIIRAVAGNKVNINVVWVIFTDSVNYVLLDEYLKNNSITYNGSVQYPTPVYLNNGTYEVLSVNQSTVGADAGDYTASLMPSKLYNYVSGAECAYTIKPLGVTMHWQNSETDTAQTFVYDYDGTAKAPYAYATDAEGNEYALSVEGKVNAGVYTATAETGKNFTVTAGDAQKQFTVNKKQISASDVVWSFDNADSTDADGKYYTYDGAAHAPTATVSFVDGNGSTVTLVMTVVGATEAAGTHTAYAIFDGGDAAHANFVLDGTASTTFRIISVDSVEVIWEFAGASGSEQDGWYWTYDGTAHAPKAYVKASDGSKGEELTVSGSFTDVGKYTVYVSSDLDFGGALPRCSFEIKAKELNVTWSDTTVTYDGKPHAPTATVENGVLGALVAGTDYTVTEFTDAGVHTAEIKFLNKNYTYASGCGSCTFTVEKIVLSGELEWRAPTGDDKATLVGGIYSWQYDAAQHAPVLVFSSPYTIGGEQVIFGAFTYDGLSASVGTHTVVATIGSATLGGKDVSANFELDVSIRTAQYAITPFEITVVWDVSGADGDEGGIPFWYYDGTAHGPEATYTDWDGNTATLSYDKETAVNANAYTATVTVPENCVLSSGSLTAQYLIKQAEVSVIWEWTDADGDDSGVPYWTYDGTAHGPKAYLKADDGSKGAELTVNGKESGAGDYVAYVDANSANYVIADGSDTQAYVINKMDVYVDWTGNADNGGKFEWTYKAGTVYAPTATLVDASGNEITDSDGNSIPVQVTGGMTDVGSYKASAVDGFANYKLAENATYKTQHDFTIVAADLKDMNFRWEGGSGATVSADGLTFTYTYNGAAQAPTARVNGGVAIELKITAEDGSEVLAITDVGAYTVTAVSADKNYVVPDNLATVTVIIVKAKVAVVWSEEKLTYNGAAQAPTAYYVDADGTEVSLDVTVDGDHVNAGKNYVATASFTVDGGNYELDSKTVTKTFEIGKKDISVTWSWGSEWNNGATDYDGSVHMPVATVATDDIDLSELLNITVYYTVKKDGKDLDGKNLKIKDAGEYVITYRFEGASADNYMMSAGEESFTINKVSLSVTLSDETVDFGDPVPAYGYTFSGFVGGETVSSLGLDTPSVLNKWLRCPYNTSTRPGTYDILVDEIYLASYLNNYDITSVGATLTVNAPDGTLIWEWGDAESGSDVIYNGKDQTPKVYYRESGKEVLVNVKVYLKADYDQDGVNATPVSIPTDVGSYVAVALYTDGVYNFTEDELIKEFAIKPLELTVVINDQQVTFGDVDEDALSDLLAKDKGWSFDGNLPVEGEGDGLEIKLTLSGTAYTDGLLNAGEYEIAGSWTANANYSVTFVGENGDPNGAFTVDKAEITVSEAVDGVNETVQLVRGGQTGKLPDFYLNSSGYLTFVGENAPEYTIDFSYVYVAGGEIPNPDEETNYIPATARPYINDVGSYVINYRITEKGDNPNHAVKYGQWKVQAVYEDEVITVKFVKPYTLTYGQLIPDNLTKALIDGGNVTVTPSADDFLANVTAVVVGADGQPVSGKLPAGRYQIKFFILSRAFSTVEIEGDPENCGLIIEQGTLDIEWGDLTIETVGDTPVIKINGETLALGDNVLTIDGEQVTIHVDMVENPETEGAYSVNVSIIGDGNYKLGGDTHKSVVLRGLNNGGGNIESPTVVENKEVPNWLWGVIIGSLVLAIILIIIVIVMVKCRPAADNDGFYEDADADTFDANDEGDGN